MNLGSLTNDDLFAQMVGTPPGAARAELLAELEDRLRYGDGAEARLPHAVRTMDLNLWCMTCGYVTDRGSTEDRDAAHLRYDGAHEPGWVDEEQDLDHAFVRNDLGLIQAILARLDK